MVVFFIIVMLLVPMAVAGFSYWRKRSELHGKAPIVSADNIHLGHLMVEDLADELADKHGDVTLLIEGTLAFDAAVETAQLADDMITAMTDAPAELIRAARMSLAPFASTIATAMEMEAEGERAAVPFLSDLVRNVKAARATPIPRTTP